MDLQTDDVRVRNITVTSAEGRIAWGYRAAATLKTCTLTRESGHWSLSASVVSHDDYRLAQRPLSFVVPQRPSWRWPVLELQIGDGTLTARLGPKE